MMPAPRPRIRRSLARLVPLLGIAAVLVLATGGTTMAHAQLVSIDPPDGARLDVTPSEVTVTFDEPIGLASGGLRVVDSSGVVVDAGDHVVDGGTVRQALDPLPAGWYIVTWGIISEDTHVVRSASVFGVGDVDAATRPAVAQAGWYAPLVASVRAIADLGLLVAAGAWAAWWLLGARTPRVRQLAVLATAVALVASCIWALSQWLDSGETWLATAAAVGAFMRIVALLIALVSASRWPTIAAGAATMALVSIAAGGHAVGSAAAVLFLVVHLVAAMAWLGAAPAVFLVLRDRSLDDATALVVVRRFSTMAPVVLVSVGVAGAVLSILLTDGFAGGFTTPYVVILATKVATVGAAALVGALARRSLGASPSRQRMRRVFTIDVLLLPLVVAASAALTTTGPHEGHVGHVAHGTDATTRCALVAGPAALSVVATPAQPGVNQLRIDGVPDAALDVGVRMTHDATSRAPIATSATLDDDGSWTAEIVLPLEGAWQTTVALRLDRFTQAHGECTLLLAG
jgi:copper transport protein